MKKARPTNEAALYFNELAPMSGENCAIFGHFYKFENDDSFELTRAAFSLPGSTWGVAGDIDGIVGCAAIMKNDEGRSVVVAVCRPGPATLFWGTNRADLPVPMDPGFLFGARNIDGHVYVCGSQNQVFRLINGAWQRMDQGIRVQRRSTQNPVLHSIDGFSESDIYAAGQWGSIVHYDGVNWRELESPTDQHLARILCDASGKVYVCGDGGVIFRGGVEGWEDLADPAETERLWGLAGYKGKVYLCSAEHLWRVDGSALTEIQVPENRSGTFYRLASNESFLWATTGTGELLRFDGNSWLSLIWPDSV
jgi:hypothetical protein